MVRNFCVRTLALALTGAGLGAAAVIGSDLSGEMTPATMAVTAAVASSSALTTADNLDFATRARPSGTGGS